MRSVLVPALAAAAAVLPLAASAAPSIAVVPVVVRGDVAVPSISVTGDGVVERSPDTASIDVTIERREDASAAAVGANAAAYAALGAKLAAVGIGASALRTLSYAVSYTPFAPRGGGAPYRTPGYYATRAIRIDVAPLERMGAAIDAATAAGASEIGDASFSLHDRRGAYAQALAEAARDARAQADALAAAAGVRIVRVRSISANSAPRFVPMLRMAAAMPAPTPVPPTELEPSGPIDVSASITVVYDVR